jgi:hypothetical protein
MHDLLCILIVEPTPKAFNLKNQPTQLAWAGAVCYHSAVTRPNRVIHGREYEFHRRETRSLPGRFFIMFW